MDQLARLLTDCGDHTRMAMPQRAHGDAHAEIQVFAPCVIAHACPLPFDKG